MNPRAVARGTSHPTGADVTDAMQPEQNENPLRFVDMGVALVLSCFASIYLVFYLPFFSGNVVRGTGSGPEFVLPLVMAVSAFFGLRDTWRTAKDPKARPMRLTPVLLLASAFVFLVHWVLMPSGVHFSAFGLCLVLLPGLLAAWSAVRIGQIWRQRRDI